ncbi:MAG: hypothetical protein QOI35_1214, partial [Cryptosporangiaceae bacterium]|nr:hypothetical protein [Cryptosporangiaceae bacterium]
MRGTPMARWCPGDRRARSGGSTDPGWGDRGTVTTHTTGTAGGPLPGSVQAEAPGPIAPPEGSAPPPPPPVRPAGHTDLRPGVVPMRPLAAGEIIDGSMAILRAHLGPALGIAAIVLVVQTAITLPVSYFTQQVAISPLGAAGILGGGATDFVRSLFGLAVNSLVGATCGGVIAAVLAVVVGDASLGREITTRTVWRQVRPRLWAIVGLALVLGILSGLGSLALGIGYLFVLGVWSLAMPALMLESTGVFGALKRSWRLSITSFWRVLGIRLLAGLAAYVLSAVLGGLLEAVAGAIAGFNAVEGSGPVQLLAVFLRGLGEMSAGVIVIPFLGGVEALLYIDRRMRAEGLD